MAVATSTALLIGGGLAIGGVGAIGGALISADASRDAAREQRKAIANAQAVNKEGAVTASAIQQPFLETGTQAFNQLSDIVMNQAAQGAPQFEFDPSQMQNDPGVKFAQEQARKSIEASAAAKGSALGAGTLQKLQERAIGLGGMQVNDAFNRQLGSFQQNQSGNQQTLSNLANIAQVGPQTASNMSNIAIGQAGNASDLAIQTGNVNAAAQVAQGEALNQGVQGATSSLRDLMLMQSMLGNKAPANATSGARLPTGAGDLTNLNQGFA